MKRKSAVSWVTGASPARGLITKKTLDLHQTSAVAPTIWIFTEPASNQVRALSSVLLSISFPQFYKNYIKKVKQLK